MKLVNPAGRDVSTFETEAYSGNCDCMCSSARSSAYSQGASCGCQCSHGPVNRSANSSTARSV